MFSYELYIARRYLFSRQRGPVVTMVMLISILGVALGVAAMIVVNSITRGANDDLFRRLIDLQGNAVLHVIEGKKWAGIQNYEEVIAAIERVPGVSAAAPLIGSSAMTFSPGEHMPGGIFIKGIDPEKELRVTGLNRNVTPANLPPLKEGEIIIGKSRSIRGDYEIGKTIRLVTRFDVIAGVPRMKQTDVRVVGIYDTGINAANYSCLVTLSQARKTFLFDEVTSGGVQSISIRLDDPFAVDRISPKIIEAVKGLIPQEQVRLFDWKTDNEEFYNTLQILRFGLTLIFILILFVAACNIIGTQALVVSRRTREVAMLMSMGASRREIRRIFWLLGMIIGAAGVILGVAGGFIVGHIVANVDVLKVKDHFFGEFNLPVHFQPLHVAGMAAFAFLICMIASVLPAWAVSRMNPVEGLRAE